MLVTGATGFVGRAVVSAFAGRPLTLATRGPWPGDAPAGCRIVEVGSIGPDTRWDEALDGVDAVLHLAAHVHVAPERAVREASVFDTVNRLASLRLFEQAAEAGVSTFVFLSSITVLGSASAEGRPFDDASPPNPETPYGASKLAAEEALRDAAASRPGTRLVILRPPLICGPGVKGNLGSLARLARLPVPLPLGGIRNRRTLLSIGNLVSALAAVLDRPAAGTYVLGDTTPLSTSDIVRALRAGAGGRMPLVPVPAPLVGAWGRAESPQHRHAEEGREARLEAREPGMRPSRRPLRRLLRMTRLGVAVRGVVEIAGFGGHARRLLGDLEVDASGFRSAYGWRDPVDTVATLRETGAAAAGLSR